MNNQDLLKLKKALPIGSLRLIARDLNLSSSYVSYVLNGKRNNDDVISLAISIAEKHKEKGEILKSKIKNLDK